MGARRERECSRGSGQRRCGEPPVGGAVGGRLAGGKRPVGGAVGRMAVTPSGRQTGRSSCFGILPNTPARSTKWESCEPERSPASELRRERPPRAGSGRFSPGIAVSELDLRLSSARPSLPGSTALSPCVLRRSFGARVRSVAVAPSGRARARNAGRGHEMQGAGTKCRARARNAGRGYGALPLLPRAGRGHEMQGAGTKCRARPSSDAAELRRGPSQKPRARKRSSAPAKERAAASADTPPTDASRKARPVRPS